MADNAEQLVSMALDRFGQLTAAEEKLFRTTANGEVADYCVGSNRTIQPMSINGDVNEHLKLNALDGFA